VSLPPGLRLGRVDLLVASLDRSVAYYQDVVGLQVHSRSDDGSSAAMGVGGEDLVVLHEDAQARPMGRHAGLFHFCLLYPSREELARAAVRLGATRTPATGASDHGTHEAIYLRDPDGLGIELAADRPRDRWPSYEAMYAHGPQPLDLEDLLATVAGEEPQAQAAEGMRMGHLHLHVGEIDRGLAFYRDTVGFDEMANLGTAAFVSAGGYHHHLGFNVWNGVGVPGAPPDAVGLRSWTIALPADGLAALRERLDASGVKVDAAAGGGFFTVDPWGTRMRWIESA
jgi:catechol 2,3-dioxygenase